MNNITDGYKKFQQIGSKTSTPNPVVITSRKSIHPDTSVSPITRSVHKKLLTSSSFEKQQRRAKSQSHSNADHSGNSCSDCEDDDVGDGPESYSCESSSISRLHDSSTHFTRSRSIVNQTHQQSRQRASNGSNLNLICGCLCLTALSALIAFFVHVMPSENTEATMNIVSIKELEDHFPEQSENLWYALETGIDEVKNFNKPSVFLLLYEDDAQQTLINLLTKISEYAGCVLKENCKIEPIKLSKSILGQGKARADYGYVIDKYKLALEEKGVMIVKNLDEIPGEVAQAFHSMCDEYTPLVPKSVFFFTIKIENLHSSDKSDLQVAEEVLRNNWKDLEDDIFYPLFTRISSMVLRIVPENIR